MPCDVFYLATSIYSSQVVEIGENDDRKFLIFPL